MLHLTPRTCNLRAHKTHEFTFTCHADTLRRVYVDLYLVKNQDSSILEHGARDGNPLSLSPGKLHPPLSHKRVKPVRKGME